MSRAPTVDADPTLRPSDGLQVGTQASAGPSERSPAPAGRALRGRFITFEGGEGTGKTTQIRSLVHRLLEFGLPVLKTREPGGTSGAEMIRSLLLTGAAKDLGPDIEAVLFSAARIDHVDRTIRPALARGTWVVSDRFADSTRVYQGLAGVEIPLLSAMERISLDGVRPDLTIVLDLDPEIGRARAAARRGTDAADRFEEEGFDADAARRRAFRALAKSDPGRCAVIDASGSSTDVAERIWRTVVERLSPSSRA